jgi:hypothetical protein
MADQPAVKVEVEIVKRPEGRPSLQMGWVIESKPSYILAFCTTERDAKFVVAALKHYERYLQQEQGQLSDSQKSLTDE